MDIRLVTTSFNDEVHATFNDKKTGCGINLLKSENVTRYRRGAIMTDLGELTCEKCKTKIAKEMIKSDQKEMKLLLKEEKMRAKKGIEDAGIVPLGNTTAKPTRARQEEPRQPKQVAVKPVSRPEPEPQPAPVQQQTIPGTGVAIDNSLAQFAINKPEEKAPVKTAAQQADDFLAQFAVPSPAAEPAPAPDQPAPQQNDDFLAQFAVPSPAAEPAPAPAPAPVEPAAPPVIDDISAAISAANANVQPAAPAPQQAAPAPSVSDDDILNMFSVENPQDQQIEAIPNAQSAAGTFDNYENDINTAEPSVSAAPVQETVQAQNEQEANSVSEWDLIANQLFGANAAQQPEVPGEMAEMNGLPNPENINIPPAHEAVASEIEDIAVPEVEELSIPEAPAPELDDISAAEPAIDIAPSAPAQSAPVIDDIAAAMEAAQQNAPKPVAPIQSAPVQQEAAPVIDDIAAAMEAAQQNAPKPVAPVQSAPVQQEAAPVIDDIAAAMEAAQQNAPKPVAPIQSAPVQQEAAPVIDDIAAAMEAAQQNAPKPVAPVQTAPAPTVLKKPVAAAQPMPNPSQIISVPQITGYDVTNQPIYTYVQMQITGYDENGQPVLAPVPGQEIPAFNAPFNKNTRLQDAIKAAQEVPTSSKDMTPGQRIAAAEAAKGSPVTANVSKIATNPHSRSTSQAFINAISESKEYANQSLTDTQGLQQRTRVIGSIEDVLSQLGDNSLKQKKAAEAKAQANVPKFEEYKAPARSSFSSSRPSTSHRSAPVDDRPLTKAELKARKKQEKIDAKFKKEMAKRGF